MNPRHCPGQPGRSVRQAGPYSDLMIQTGFWSYLSAYSKSGMPSSHFNTEGKSTSSILIVETFFPPLLAFGADDRVFKVIYADFFDKLFDIIAMRAGSSMVVIFGNA